MTLTCMTLTHLRYRYFAHSHGLLARHAGGGGTDRGHAPAACCRTVSVNDGRRSWRAVALGRRREWGAAGLARLGATAAIRLRMMVSRAGRTGRKDQKTAMCVVRRTLGGGMALPSIMMASTRSALLGLSVAEPGDAHRVKPDPGRVFCKLFCKRLASRPDGQKHERFLSDFSAQLLMI